MSWRSIHFQLTKNDDRDNDVLYDLGSDGDTDGWFGLSQKNICFCKAIENQSAARSVLLTFYRGSIY